MNLFPLTLQDPLFDGAVNYERTLREKGVKTELKIYNETIHGFVSLPFLFSETETALQDIATFVAAV